MSHDARQNNIMAPPNDVCTATKKGPTMYARRQNKAQRCMHGDKTGRSKPFVHNRTKYRTQLGSAYIHSTTQRARRELRRSKTTAQDDLDEYIQLWAKLHSLCTPLPTSFIHQGTASTPTVVDTPVPKSGRTGR